jgi:uncharacterized Zn-finger protein
MKCKVWNCENEARAKKTTRENSLSVYCHTHRMQVFRKGKIYDKTKCIWNTCQKNSKVKGYCRQHYNSMLQKKLWSMKRESFKNQLLDIFKKHGKLSMTDYAFKLKCSRDKIAFAKRSLNIEHIFLMMGSRKYKICPDCNSRVETNECLVCKMAESEPYYIKQRKELGIFQYL